MHILFHLFALAACELSVSQVQTEQPQILDSSNKYRSANVTINVDSFTEIRNESGSFFIKRLAHGADWVHDCFEVRKEHDILREYDAALDFKFCYPSLHVAGIAKCGTSALYNLFTNHHKSITTLGLKKEYCPLRLEHITLYSI
jgi:hypothetical protein